MFIIQLQYNGIIIQYIKLKQKKNNKSEILKLIINPIQDAKLVKQSKQFQLAYNQFQMKRLLQIVQLSQLYESFQLQNEYRSNKNNLKSNTKSLKVFYSLAKNFKNKLQNFADDLDNLLEIRNGKQKRRSKIDYYTFFIQKVIALITTQIRKISNETHKIYEKAKNVYKQCQLSLQNTTKTFEERSNHHEIILKDYCQTVFPQTTSIMYKLHLINDDEIIKKQDSIKQAAMVQEAKLYNLLLHDYIKSNENLIQNIEAETKIQALSIKQLLTQTLEKLPQKLIELEIEEKGIQQFMKTIDETSRSRSKSRGKSKGKNEVPSKKKF